ncbi:MAG: ECF transporter S component, partial [Oscillospiraceae bacterium]|nr:ECF transporter S component [Oscillospiraceae bacterium]
MKRTNTRYMIQLTLLIAIQIIMGAVPGLGLIPVTPVFNLTTLHIPVIVGAAVLGVKAGAVLGLTFGLTSMIRAIYVPTIFNWPFTPAATGSFYSVLIAIVPRVALGILAAYVFILL